MAFELILLSVLTADFPCDNWQTQHPGNQGQKAVLRPESFELGVNIGR